MPAWIFGGLSRLRAKLYEWRLLPRVRVDIPVVSVGNLTAGGTGKTPFVARIAALLGERGKRVGLLSRGYGAKLAAADVKSGANGKMGEGGGQNDEALLLAQLLPGTDHVLDPDRVRGALELCNRGVDVILLDDGFQHRRLERDLDIVLVDASRPWGLAAPDKGGEPVCAYLPRGLLREGPSALARADLIVLTHTERVDADERQRLVARLRAAAPACRVLEAEHRPIGLRVIGPQLGRGGEPLGSGLEYLQGKDVDLVSAIGNPEAFEASVVALGARVHEHRCFPDHHGYVEQDLGGLGARPVVTTSKDAVKLARLATSCLVLEIEMAIVQGADALDASLAGLPESSHQRARRSLHEGLHG